MNNFEYIGNLQITNRAFPPLCSHQKAVFWQVELQLQQNKYSRFNSLLVHCILHTTTRNVFNHTLQMKANIHRFSFAVFFVHQKILHSWLIYLQHTCTAVTWCKSWIKTLAQLHALRHTFTWPYNLFANQLEE